MNVRYKTRVTLVSSSDKNGFSIRNRKKMGVRRQLNLFAPAIASSDLEAHRQLRAVLIGDAVRTLRALRIAESEGQYESDISPPQIAKRILYIIAGKDIESLIGDFEDMYAIVYRKRGKQQAIWWYTSHIIRSCWPLLIRMSKRLRRKI